MVGHLRPTTATTATVTALWILQLRPIQLQIRSWLLQLRLLQLTLNYATNNSIRHTAGHFGLDSKMMCVS